MIHSAIDRSSARAGGHIDFLDPIRGVAILLVVAFHTLGASYGIEQLHWRRIFRDFSDAPASFLPFLPVTFGWLGVAVFFAVSGFCIHLSYQRATVKTFKVFFLRRFFRIYPPYFAALCLFAFLLPLATFHSDCISSGTQFWTHALMACNFNEDLHYGINPSFWSIVVEVQLYLIYPLLLWIVRRFGWGTALWIIGALEISLRVIGSSYCLPYWIIGSPFYYWFSWSIGARLADDHLNGRPLFLAGNPLWLWPVLTVASNLLRPLSTLTFVFAALATAQFISHKLTQPIRPAQSSGAFGLFLTRMGVISYSLYLLHQPFLNIFAYLLKSAVAPSTFPPLLLFASLLLFCGVLFAGCVAFYRWLELPSIALGKRVVAKLLAPAPRG